MTRRSELWRYGVLAALFYPQLIAASSNAIRNFRAEEDALQAAFAAVLLLGISTIPVLCMKALFQLGRDDDAGLKRIGLCLAFAVSPLFVLFSQLVGRAGYRAISGSLWIVLWALVVSLILFLNARRGWRLRPHLLRRLRIVHGAAALLLVGSFLLPHLFNHSTAIWSVEVHTQFLNAFRLFYRSVLLEPVLLTAFACMVLTGLPMARHHASGKADPFGNLQFATGIYLALFLGAHLLAVLSARAMDKDTDWIFATGSNGLLDGRRTLLIPYYFWAVLSAFLHIESAVRNRVRVLAAKKSKKSDFEVAEKVFRVVLFLGGIVALLFLVAAFGFHVGPE